jgi:hypothetical protein
MSGIASDGRQRSKRAFTRADKRSSFVYRRRRPELEGDLSVLRQCVTPLCSLLWSPLLSPLWSPLWSHQSAVSMSARGVRRFPDEKRPVVADGPS